jgi:hypothetical protein
LTRRLQFKHMKTILATSLLLLSFNLSAVAKPHKGGGRPPAQQQAPGAAQPPSARLSQFTANHLDAILGPIDQRPPLPRTRVSQLQAAFTDEGAKAPEPEKAQYQTAIAVCIALNTAMDEREKAIASLQGSEAVHGPSDLGARRKDIPTKGGIGTAMLADAELRREAHEERNRKQEARQNDNFLDTQLKTNWTQRTIQIRQNIQLLMERQREAERSAQQPAAATNATPAANTITLDKPIHVKVKYGTATIQAGTTLPVVNRDANGVVVQYMGENVLLPP